MTAKPPTAPHLKGRWIRENTRKAIYQRDGYRCRYCDKDLSDVPASQIVLDHRDPQGRNNPENLVTSCKACNDEKEGKTDVDYLREKRKNGAAMKKNDLLARLAKARAAKKPKAKPAKGKRKVKRAAKAKPRKDAFGIADAEKGQTKTVSRVNKKGTQRAKRKGSRISTKAAPDPRGFSKVSNSKKTASALI